MSTRVPLFWFHFEDADDARAVTRRAAYAGIASAVVTAALATWALASPEGVFGGALDGWAFLDVALLLALSAGTYRGNRFAATALLVVYVVEQIASRVTTGNTGGLLVSGLFTVLFVQGMLGAFALHRLRPDDEIDGQIAALEAGDPPARLAQ